MKNQIKILMTLVLMTLFISCIGEKASNTPTQVKHKIYGVAVSPYVAKVRMYMEANKTPYELEEVLPLSLLRALGKNEHKKLKEISPLGQVPAYENQKTAIADSTVILQYLEDLASEGKLSKGLSAEEKAEVNFIEKYADSKLANSTRIILVEKLVKPLLFKKEADSKIVKESIKELYHMLLFLEKKLEGKKYFVAERLTKADFAVMSHLGSLLRTKFIESTVDNGQYPVLSSYFKRLKKEEFFKVTHELS